MTPALSHRRGAILILVVGLIAILATIATAFLARSRGSAAVGEDAMRLAQSRIMLNAALTYIREASRLGYAVVEGNGDPAQGDLLVTDAREAWGWIDTRVKVPGPGRRVGPNATDGTPLWTVGGDWPAPGGTIRAPMYRMLRPPFAVSQDYVRNPIPTDIEKPTFGIPFLTNVDPIPLLPEGSYFDIDQPSGGQTFSPVSPSYPPLGATNAARKVWAEGDRTPVPGTTDLAWFRIYRELLVPNLLTPDPDDWVSGEGSSQGVPANAGICTFVITVGAGGTRGYRDWDEVRTANDEASFSGSSEFFEELERHEQRQWFRVGWSAAVGGGEDLSVMPAINDILDTQPERSHYEVLPLNASRWSASEIIAPSHPRNYGGTITFIQRLDEPPPNF